VLRERGGERPVVATKAGRRLSPHVAEGYTRENLTASWTGACRIWASRRWTSCSSTARPTAVYYMPEVFGALDDLVRRGKLRHYGVSVEKVEEALKAIEFPGVVSVQIIWNMFRQRPGGAVLPGARRSGGGDRAGAARLGAADGEDVAASQFAADDHRAFNRDGEAFDKGETFSGVPFDVALDAVEACGGAARGRARWRRWRCAGA
jgi:aryl-alcohol dehydrogenase-like predicted oxidoreductase